MVTTRVISGKIQVSTHSEHWTDFSMRAVKTYSNTESHAKHKKDSWEAMDGDTVSCNPEGTSTRSG